MTMKFGVFLIQGMLDLGGFKSIEMQLIDLLLEKLGIRTCVNIRPFFVVV